MSQDKTLPPDPRPPTSLGSARRRSLFGGSMYRVFILFLLTFFVFISISLLLLVVIFNPRPKHTAVSTAFSTNAINSSQGGVHHHYYHHHYGFPNAAGEIVFYDYPNMETSQHTESRILSTAEWELHLHYLLVQIAEALTANHSNFSMTVSVSKGVLRATEAFAPSREFASTFTSIFTSTVTSTVASTVTSNILSTVYSTVTSTVVPTASPYPWPGTDDGAKAVMEEVEEASDVGSKRTNEGTVGMKRADQFVGKLHHLFDANGCNKQNRAGKLKRLGLMWQERLSKAKKGAQRARQMGEKLKEEVRVAAYLRLCKDASPPKKVVQYRRAGLGFYRVAGT